MSESRVNTQFGPYRLDALLGRGGMGEVYRAYDTGKDRVVALKLLNPGLAADPEYRERFRRESRTAARLGDPHVIPIHDWGEVDGVLFIDMRLVQGGDLRGVLTREHRLDPRRAVSIVEQIGAALDAAHTDGLIHRDVKPENILVGSRDFAYLVDFGIANAAGDTRLTQAGSAIGSIAYMAPELFDGKPASPASDVYALACVLFESLTGQVPFPATTVSAAIKAAVTSPPPRATALVPGLPGMLDAVIAGGLDPDPARRYRSAGELAAAAVQALSTAGRPVAAPPATAPVYQTTQVQQVGPQYSGPQYSAPQLPPKSNTLLLLGIAAAVLTIAIAAGIGFIAFGADNEAPLDQAEQNAVAEASASAVPTSAVVTTREVVTTTVSSTTSGRPPVRTYPAPSVHVEVLADPSDPGYVPPPPHIDDAYYFAQFGAFNQPDTAREKAGQHYGAVIVDGSHVGLSTRYAVVRPTNSMAEAELVCSKFGPGDCYPVRRAG
ncbi:MAG: serine/threonine-protein kinase [Gordonia sp. (in: high G+C Gram-positive bacteria)]|uniref:serine/threonine-protein kinase n=1 Tax=Gordonia sp. (in: high G+C Gram-positive bacteria) TaxID=84139 RepID=UPI003BB511FE